jgi:hypothetical protein
MDWSSWKHLLHQLTAIFFCQNLVLVLIHFNFCPNWILRMLNGFKQYHQSLQGGFTWVASKCGILIMSSINEMSILHLLTFDWQEIRQQKNAVVNSTSLCWCCESCSYSKACIPVEKNCNNALIIFFEVMRGSIKD